MLYFRQGSIDSKDVDIQGTLLRKCGCCPSFTARIADLILYMGEFSCNQTDAKWLLFPFNKSCRFVIQNPLFLNIYFDVVSLCSLHA